MGRLVNLTLLYGEGLFETLLVRPGRRPVLAALHRARMLAGARALGYPLTAARFDRALGRALARLDPDRPHRLRLTLLVYGDPIPRRSRLRADAVPLPAEPPFWTPLRLLPLPFPGGPGLPYKTTAYLPHHLLWRRARAQGFDDALLLNADGRPFSLSRANLWTWDGERLRTPPVGEGALPGTFRRFLLETGPAVGLGIAEAPLTVEDLAAAKAVFATNGLRLLIPIGEIAGVGRWGEEGLAFLRELWGRIRGQVFGG